MFTTKDMNLLTRAKRNVQNIEAVAGERIWLEYAKDGIVYFHLLHNCQRKGCRMNAAGMVKRIFPIT